MKISSLIQEEPGSAVAISKREEITTEEKRQEQRAAYDTVSISPEARERLEVQESAETGDKKGGFRQAGQ